MGCASKWAPVKNCGRRKVLTGTIDVKNLWDGMRMGLTLKAVLYLTTTTPDLEISAG